MISRSRGIRHRADGEILDFDWQGLGYFPLHKNGVCCMQSGVTPVDNENHPVTCCRSEFLCLVMLVGLCGAVRCPERS
ncbi:Breast Carcinoma-Amplified Sequence 3 [Manis pentadactyla]|nr:Breast Carcinoma-Amplified Sequence 3 [Manis pentadactyla]